MLAIKQGKQIFPFEEALEMITWGNFRERVIMALNESQHPFLVEFYE